MFGKRITFQQAIFVLAVLATCTQCTLSFDEPNLTLDEVRERIQATQGEEQLKYKLHVLTRFDFPPDYRIQISDELINQYERLDQPLILGKAYLAKGTGHLHLGKLKSAIELLEKAEELGKQFEAEDPSPIL